MRQVWYNVEPRYTPGSPALVGETLAMRIAEDERRFYQHALDGTWGEEQKQRAEKLGLDLIVFRLTDRKNGYDVADIVTGRRYRWPHMGKCPVCGARVACQRGVITEHHTRTSYHHTFRCDGTGRYVGEEVK